MKPSPCWPWWRTDAIRAMTTISRKKTGSCCPRKWKPKQTIGTKRWEKLLPVEANALAEVSNFSLKKKHFLYSAGVEIS